MLYKAKHCNEGVTHILHFHFHPAKQMLYVQKVQKQVQKCTYAGPAGQRVNWGGRRMLHNQSFVFLSFCIFFTVFQCVCCPAGQRGSGVGTGRMLHNQEAYLTIGGMPDNQLNHLGFFVTIHSISCVSVHFPLYFHYCQRFWVGGGRHVPIPMPSKWRECLRSSKR